MTAADLGSIGAILDPAPGEDLGAAAAALEQYGFHTIWLAGGKLERLDQVQELLDGTQRARISTAIIAADRFEAQDVLAMYRRAEATHPGRLILGLGGAHGPKPLATLNAYLDELAEVPASARILAALGDRMLELARDRAGGALPLLVTPEYTAAARARLGPSTLAIQLMVVLEPDPARAREIAAMPLQFLRSNPGYRKNFRRMGFTDEDIEQLSDRLVDALVAWGDAEAIAARVAEHRQAGADHVAVMLLTPPAEGDGWEILAGALI